MQIDSEGDLSPSLQIFPSSCYHIASGLAYSKTALSMIMFSIHLLLFEWAHTRFLDHFSVTVFPMCGKGWIDLFTCYSLGGSNSFSF